MGRMNRSGTVRRFVAATLVVVIAAACTSEPETPAVAPEPVDQEIYGGFPIDPPAPDEVVLTLEGDVRVELTMSELEAMAVAEVTLDEPFVRRRETFRVIPLEALFELAGIGDDETVQTIALNDYRYSDRAGALRAADALLAVARDGQPIPMDAGGPIRLVFADDSSYSRALDAWNWSLRTIRRIETP
jgi:hypothetical protein